jgi:predicted membrane-bound spermidine synthase
MSEKFQYGQRVEYEVTEKLLDFETSKAHVEWVQTRYHGKMLLMDEEVQFSTLDEHRYHEKLVGMLPTSCKRVLILGGGDGLAAREVYARMPDVTNVTIVDWDQEFVELFALGLPENKGSLKDERTHLEYTDAYVYLYSTHDQSYDGVIIDLPDPDGDEMIALYHKIITVLYRVIHLHTAIVSHVGPVSLCKDHPNWEFIQQFKDQVRKSFAAVPKFKFDYVYVPSFSHEWGFLQWEFGLRKDSNTIEDIYRRL